MHERKYGHVATALAKSAGFCRPQLWNKVNSTKLPTLVKVSEALVRLVMSWICLTGFMPLLARAKMDVIADGTAMKTMSRRIFKESSRIYRSNFYKRWQDTGRNDASFGRFWNLDLLMNSWTFGKNRFFGAKYEFLNLEFKLRNLISLLVSKLL